jgi:WD40 repeat protein
VLEQFPIVTPTIVFVGAHKSPIICLDFSRPVGCLLATGDAAGILAVWNIFTGDLVAKFKNAHSGGISTVTIMKDQRILTTGFDKMARIFKLSDVINLKTQSFEFSPESSQSSFSEIPKGFTKTFSKLFSKREKKVVPIGSLILNKELRGHKGEIFSCCTMPTTFCAATGATDSTIKVGFN